MRNETVRAKLFTRRALMLSGFKAFFLSTLAARLYYLQIIKSSEYTTLSDSNRIKLLLLPPLRGNILDRFGNLLAANKGFYRALLDKRHTEDLQESFNKATALLQFDEERKQVLFKKLSQNTMRAPTVLSDHLSWKDVATLEARSIDIPGVYVEVGQTRYYPFGITAGHITGYTGAVSEAELEDEPLLSHPDFKIGKNAIERSCENILRGQAGVLHTEVNAHGRAVRELAREESVPGHDVTLTVDIRLQEFALSRLENRGSAAVVVDITNGDILALASAPGFDPNEFAQGLSTTYWNSIVENPYFPLINRTISREYPPGSTFKIMVALAALHDGIDPETTVYCPGYVTMGSRKFHCWKSGGHGNVNMTQAIMHSCNSYFYTMGRKIGVDSFATMARHFGLGERTGVELPGEKKGLIPTRRWKWARLDKEWQMGDTLNSSIGQGFVLATPLQLAVMTARIASGGKKVMPHLVVGNIPTSNLTERNGAFEDIGIPSAHMAIVQAGMTAVVNTPGGTAYGARIADSHYRMAGKTGTSQVVSKKYAGQDNSKHGRWEDRNHGLFIGYAPIENPRYACAVIIEHGGSGSGAAAPVGRDILLKAQQLNAGIVNNLNVG